MYTLEQIASNAPHTEEESREWLKTGKSRPTCSCLRASETGCEQYFRCAVGCDAEMEIIYARQKLKEAQG